MIETVFYDLFRSEDQEKFFHELRNGLAKRDYRKIVCLDPHPDDGDRTRNLYHLCNCTAVTNRHMEHKPVAVTGEHEDIEGAKSLIEKISDYKLIKHRVLLH